MLQTVRCIEQRWLTVVLSLLCAVLAGRALGAQTIGGTVSGVITDPSGSAIPLAAVVFRSISMQTVRAIRANESGFYSVPNLTPGEYQVRASAPGFELQIVYITLTVGAEQELNFNLRVGLLDQSVEVQAPPAGLEFASSAIGGVVNENTLREVPLNGRGWTDLAALDPGVAPIEAQVSYTAGVGRGNRGFGAQLAISGARPQQNNYLLDGISINDYSNGGPGSVLGGNLGVDAIQEFSIFTANYPAAYGRASGGVISAATRSGSNQFHGSVYEFLRNSVLDARNFFDKASPPPFRRNQYGVSVAGPVIKNQT